MPQTEQHYRWTATRATLLWCIVVRGIYCALSRSGRTTPRCYCRPLDLMLLPWGSATGLVFRGCWCRCFWQRGSCSWGYRVLAIWLIACRCYVSWLSPSILSPSGLSLPWTLEATRTWSGWEQHHPRCIMAWFTFRFCFLFSCDGLQPTLTTPRSDFALVLFVLLLRIGLLVMYFVVCVKICRG